jgi:aminopeptidase N
LTPTRRSAVILAVALLCVVAMPPAGGQGFTEGSSGLGDPFFPHAGNGGYDVDHYSLAFTFRPHRNFINGQTVIDAHATQDLSRFNLDLRGFHVGEITVDGHAATFEHRGQELIITPASGIADGAPFQVTIPYKGRPKLVTDPDKSYEGWATTEDGAFVVGEPQGSPGWYPANDYPADKATYDFTVRVPNGLTAVANGALVSKTVANKWTTFVWSEGVLMAPYLATVTTGKFKVTQSQTKSGIPVYNAVAPNLVKDSRKVLRKQNRIVDFFQDVYGDYPYEVVGAVIDEAPKIGYALETQSKPVYAYRPEAAEVAHEIAHQWLGDDVTLRSWPDIWLNEGWATWSQWLWNEHIGRETAHHRFDDLYTTPANKDGFWNPPPADLGEAKNLFSTSTYLRGAMTLQALREEIGDRKFMKLARRWISDHHLGNASTADFVDLAEKVAHRKLDHLFDAWLFDSGKPSNW